MNQRALTLCFALAVLIAVAGDVQAQSSFSYTDRQVNSYINRNSANRFTSRQFENQVYRRTVPTNNFSPVNRNLLQSYQSTPRPVKPFADYDRGPSVSPYLGLGGLPAGDVPNYYSLVRPQLDQQRVNDRQRQAAIRQQQQLQSVAARAPYDVTGTETMSPTGHPAVFQNYLGYYPQPSSR